MSVTIRLAREGRKNAPSYKIVAANTRDKRNGRALDILGHYNPSTTPVEYKLDKEKYDKWISNGALVSDAVTKLIAGTYEYTPYSPNQNVSEDKKEDSVEDEETGSGTDSKTEQTEEEVEQNPESEETEDK